MKHTPGPWKATYGQLDGITGWRISTPALYNMAWVWWEPPMLAHIQKANAKLMAKAPEMLTAINDALACLENLSVRYNFRDSLDDAEAEALDVIEKLEAIVSDVGE